MPHPGTPHLTPPTAAPSAPTTTATAVPTPPPVVSSTPGSFPHAVLADRHPALIRQVREAHPYGPREHRALDALLEEITDGVIGPPDPATPGHGAWTAWGREHIGRSWFEVPFLWAESYFYRRLLDAVGHAVPGPWQGIDPFGPLKRAELTGATVTEELRALDALADATPTERAGALLHASLWGNRADLGFALTPAPTATPTPTAAPAGTPETPAPALVADDSALLWSLLPAGGGGTVAVLADNAGRELIPDLLLIDHLLEHGHADRAVLHVKPHPYFVSDATTADVSDALHRLTSAPGEAGRTGTRLWRAATSGRLTLRAHPFACAPLPYHHMPRDLRAELAEARLTLVKGDLNYRRLVGDHHWDPTTPFTTLTAHFPGPVAALRTLKSDVITGLAPTTLAALDSSPTPWRTKGTHAVIQTRP
ncbi:damage-control phosphatase ARMT1 family protein [Streptomyces sp. NPDC097619]|uniref:damage-control phosphatase ARMT1 family protein n=1 Tax=Streptomyces sp. NPDC097619 TaxID=3157228 RepID=UPI0033170217